jgi:predicted metal-dependent hydrolase
MPNLPANISRVIRTRRRTIALIVERDGSVTVRAPMKMSWKAIEEFVQKHATWVEIKQAELQATVPRNPREYRAGETFLYLGQVYPLEIVADMRSKLELDSSFKLAESAQGDAEAAFRGWYRDQARKIIEERVARLADQFRHHVNKIRITSARTRWGSCSSTGTLSFSWRLIMTSPAVIDYVIIHELAHTVHHNHSKKFWSLVEEWMPDYQERRKELRQYGKLLFYEPGFI